MPHHSGLAPRFLLNFITSPRSWYKVAMYKVYFHALHLGTCGRAEAALTCVPGLGSHSHVSSCFPMSHILCLQLGNIIDISLPRLTDEANWSVDGSNSRTGCRGGMGPATTSCQHLLQKDAMSQCGW